MRGAFRSLGVRNYRLFAAGQVVSLTGTWMQRVAQDWLVLELTHTSGAALGLTTGLQFLPVLLFGLYGGVVADRYDKRRTLLWTQSISGLLALLLGVLTLLHAVQLWEVYALAFTLGLVGVVDTPVRQSFVTEMVGPRDVTNAVSLNSATFNAARIVGPAVAGLLINLVDVGPVFLINAVSFVAVLGGLVLMRPEELFLTPPIPRARGQLREGLRYVRGRPELLLPIVLVGIVGTFGLNFQITLALVARAVFHRGAGSYGLLSTALAAGSLIGALGSATRSKRLPRLRLLVGSAVAFGVLEVVVGLMPSYLALALLLVPAGAAAITFTTAANSTVQVRAVPEMRGRVMALYVLVFLGGTPVGAPLIGALAQVSGARSGLVVGGAVSAVAAAVTGLVLRRRLGRLAAVEAAAAARIGAVPEPAAGGEALALAAER